MGKDTETIKCQCGCGEDIPAYTKLHGGYTKQKRKFVRGHQYRIRSVKADDPWQSSIKPNPIPHYCPKCHSQAFRIDRDNIIGWGVIDIPACINCGYRVYPTVAS